MDKNKKIFGISTLLSTVMIGVAVLSASIANRSDASIAAKAANPQYTYTFNKSTWNGDYSKNSIETSFGNELALEMVTVGSEDILVGEEIDGIASLKGNGCRIAFAFPIQNAVSMTVTFEGDAKNSFTAKYGNTKSSTTSNAGYITSGTAKIMSYYGSNKYYSLEFYVGSYSTDRIVVTSIEITYTCA